MARQVEKGMPHALFPAGESLELSPGERETLRLLADTIVPRTGDPREPLGGSASDLGVDPLIAQAIQDYQPPDVQKQFLLLLRAVESPLMNLVLAGRPVRFRNLSAEGRERYLKAWTRSRLGLKRRGFHAVKRFTAFLYYTALGPDGRNPNWPAIGYDPPDDVERARHRTSPELRIEPMAVDADATVDTDLAVIGSGAGGAVIAAKAAEAGHRVLVIEAGALLTPDTFTQRELPGTDGMLERHGLMTTKDFAFGVLHGRVAGGGTTVNWMTSLRPPPWALEEWEREYGIPGLTGPGFQACIDEVWDRLGVTTAESVLTPPSEVLRRGCLALGYEEGRDFHVTAKNARGCENRCDYCNFGCIYSAKQSTLATYLPDAARHGARFLFDTEARTISTRTGGTSVEAVHRSDARERRLEIRAKVVVVAAGGIQTPALLLRSGFRHPGIGRGLRLDPTTGVGGVYRHDIRMWAGVPQTLTIDRWLGLGDHHGFWIETAPAHPGLTALGFPWQGGRAHKERMRLYRHLAANIILVRDTTAGRVTVDAQGNPVMEYRMARRDRDMLIQGIIESARIHAAAGARSVWSIHNEPCEIPDRDGPIAPSEVDAFAERARRLGIRENGIALFSAHAMGSVPMGASERMPTTPTGRLRGAESVFVGDGSVLPSAPGVNPMIAIMAMARRTADHVVTALKAAS